MTKKHSNNKKTINNQQKYIIYFFLLTSFSFIIGYITSALKTAKQTGLNNQQIILLEISFIFALTGWAFSSYILTKTVQETIKEQTSLKKTDQGY